MREKARIGEAEEKGEKARDGGREMEREGKEEEGGRVGRERIKPRDLPP